MNDPGTWFKSKTMSVVISSSSKCRLRTIGNAKYKHSDVGCRYERMKRRCRCTSLRAKCVLCHPGSSVQEQRGKIHPVAGGRSPERGILGLMVRTSISSSTDGIRQTEVGRLPMASPCVTCNQEDSRAAVVGLETSSGLIYCTNGGPRTN